MQGMITSSVFTGAAIILNPVISSVTGVDPDLLTSFVKNSPMAAVLIWFMWSHAKQMREMQKSLDRSTRASMLAIVTNEAVPPVHKREAERILDEVRGSTT